MKMTLAVAGCIALTVGSLFAQEPADESGVATGVVTTNAPAAESEGGTNEVTIEDLMKLPSFTNDTGVVMVKISDALWVGAYEVTQEEYQKIAGANPSRFAGGRRPVESVSWNDAMAFCKKLSEVEGEKKMLPEGFAYQLPTQSQWESFAVGAELKDAIFRSGPARSGTAEVGTLGATGPGVYDIRGNVREWCLDPTDRPFRVARGAAWNTFIEINLRPEFRWFEKPDEGQEMIGFRVVLQAK